MRTKIFAGLLVFIAFVLIGGCAAPTATPAATPTSPLPTSTPTIVSTSTPEPVTLQYIGHSSILITAPDGTRIISDPYQDRPRGLATFPADLTADVVTISHHHPDHANVSAIKGKPKILLTPGSYQAGMVKITGYEGDHGLVGGQSSGENTVFIFEIGDVKIVHLGAAGVVTQRDILAALEKADVVIMDIMGDTAHPLKEELDQLLEHQARTIIPTHYSFEENPRYYGSATLNEFLQIVPPKLAVIKLGSTLQVTADMPEQLVVLAPAANEDSEK